MRELVLTSAFRLLFALWIGGLSYPALADEHASRALAEKHGTWGPFSTGMTSKAFLSAAGKLTGFKWAKDGSISGDGFHHLDLTTPSLDWVAVPNEIHRIREFYCTPSDQGQPFHIIALFLNDHLLTLSVSARTLSLDEFLTKSEAKFGFRPAEISLRQNEEMLSDRPARYVNRPAWAWVGPSWTYLVATTYGEPSVGLFDDAAAKRLPSELQKNDQSASKRRATEDEKARAVKF